MDVTTIAALNGDGRSAISGAISCAGVCIFLALFWHVGHWDFPLLALSACAMASIVVAPSHFPKRVSPKGFSLVGLFVLLYITSALASPRWPRNLAGIESFLPALLLYFVIVIQLDKAVHYRAVSRALCVLSLTVAITVISALVRDVDGNPRHWVLTARNAILAVPNDIVLVAILSPFCIALATRSSTVFWRIIGLLALLLGIVAIVVLNSRTAFVTQLVAVAGLALGSMGWRNRKAWGWVAGVLVAGVTVDSLRGFELWGKFFGPEGFGGLARGSLWIAAFAMFIDAPIVGHGPHAFGEMWREYLKNAQFPVTFPVDGLAIAWTHNLYLELLCELGLAGFVSFALLTGRALAISWSFSNRHQGWQVNIAAPLFVAILCFLEAALFELTLQRIWVVNIWFMFLAIAEGLRLTEPATT